MTTKQFVGAPPMPPPPYIGICDFTRPEQIWAMLAVVKEFYDLTPVHLRQHLRKLMAGLMMTRKTLLGIPSRWENVFPKNGSIKRIFVPHEHVINTIHYADYDNETALKDLRLATELGGPNLNAIQLDMVLPSPEMLAAYRAENPDILIILQMGGVALEQLGYAPEKLVKAVASYNGLIEYVLLDESMGKGRGMDAKVLDPLILAIVKEFPNLGITLGGGLGPRTWDLPRSLIAKYNRLSLDAQGKMRLSGDLKDPIHWASAEEYWRNSAGMFVQEES